jgi:trehalose/maltose hydrolase-like predicted phosphorylase
MGQGMIVSTSASTATHRDDPWVLSADEPRTDRLYLANGYMSTALDFSSGMLFDSVLAPCYIRGVYTNGGSGGIDRLARIPCWNHFRYGHEAVLERYHRELNLREGIVRTRMTLREDRGPVELTQEMFVSRADQHQAAIRLTVVPSFDGEIEILAGIDAPISGDVHTLAVEGAPHALSLRSRVPPYDVEIAQALTFEIDGARVDVFTGQNSAAAGFALAAHAGESAIATQLVRVATSLEGDDFLEIACRRSDPYDQLREAHIAAWERLWQTDIEVEGDPEVQQFARAGLFYLWSTVREGDHWSIAPMGLSSNGYNGHIFWDAELWMYPTLLVTQPEMGRSCVAYRERTLPAARMRAASNGHRGAQFPWEGAFTGEEMTPHWAETRDFQLHITADVAIGQWWYYLVTRDEGWLRQHGFPVIRECAEHWVSRVEHNVDNDRYEVSDVVCADEYAAHVDNDAFTNAAVRKALRIAVRAAGLLGEPAPAEWSVIADKMYVPYDAQACRHVEFDGYDGQVTKQADVELLAFPLEEVTDRGQIERDLDYYGTVIDPHGPAMSFSVYAILSAQLGRPGDAYEYLKRSYIPNTRRPFWSFSETPTNNEFHFCTGVGGALQALLFGFTGLRLREAALVLGPILPEHWRALRLRNVCVLGARTDIEVEPHRTCVRRHGSGGDLMLALDWERREVTATRESGTEPMWIEFDGEEPIRMRSEKPVPFPREVSAGFRLRVRGAASEDLLHLVVQLP